MDNDINLAAVEGGSMRRVIAALEAGAGVNGHSERPFVPIVAATMAGHAGMVEFLLEQGADPDKPVTSDPPTATPGERALHIAARTGNVEIVRLLLKRSRADPNATDNKGRTPLIAACDILHVCVEVVRLLLEAGADPALAEERGGYIPLHLVAIWGGMDLVDMMYSSAPETLNLCSADRQTPLYLACLFGHKSMVSKLLSLGATQRFQRLPRCDSGRCPLSAAIRLGFVGVVRVMINEGGVRAVGGKDALTQALHTAVRRRHTKILRLLLNVDGEEKRSEWANASIEDSHLLHIGTAYRLPAAVSVLLEAGADEAARDSDGRIPGDVIGPGVGQDGEPRMDRGKEIAMRRMLQRGPAYRARSWAWPSDEEADAGGSGDDHTAGAAAASALSSPPAVKTSPVAGVRIFRPKEKTSTSSKLFARLVDRYCAKG